MQTVQVNPALVAHLNSKYHIKCSLEGAPTHVYLVVNDKASVKISSTEASFDKRHAVTQLHATQACPYATKSVDFYPQFIVQIPLERSRPTVRMHFLVTVVVGSVHHRVQGALEFFV